MRLIIKFALLAGLFLSLGTLEARIRLVSFENESKIAFCDNFSDGTPFKSLIDSGQGVLIDQEGAEIESVDGNYTIILEDGFRSGFHRPHWKYHVWLKSKTGFPFLAKTKMLYAVIFYDGDGEVKLSFDQKGRLHVTGGYDVKDILYPWAKGTVGRGNPYHEIKGTEVDQNGVKYFDYNGFVAFPFNLYED